MEKGEANKGELQQNNSSIILRQSTWTYTHIAKYIIKRRNNLKQEKRVEPSSSVAPLSSFIRSTGLLSVGGILKTANTPPNSKHQFLISKHHSIVNLLITDIHLNYVHCGREYTLYNLRKNYWIPGRRGLIRKILSNRFFCKRQTANQYNRKWGICLISLYSHTLNHSQILL